LKVFLSTPKKILQGKPHISPTPHQSEVRNFETAQISTNKWQMFHLQQQHLFNDPLSRTARVSQYEKGKTNLDFTEARE